jgi:hypothetical protein
VAAAGGALIGIGGLEVFALYGLVPLVLGMVLVVISVRHSQTHVLMSLLATVLALIATVSLLLWGAEHIWANPSCTQHPNQTSGQINYWSGASVRWTCVNGQPVVTHDSR